MASYDYRFIQMVRFVGPEPVEVFDPGFGPQGFHNQRMYRTEPDRQIAEADFRRRVLQHAANTILKIAQDERNGERHSPRPYAVDLGPLGILKNVGSIMSIHFNRDLEIEYECYMQGEFEF